MRKMTSLEIKVLNLIPIGFRPKRAEMIRQQTGLSKRDLEHIIEDLRMVFGHPIVSSKRKPYGYYIPTTEEERIAGLRANIKQIETEQKIVSTILSIDLQEYWKGRYDDNT